MLSTEKMNRIKEINAADFVAVVEAGVITKDLQDAVEKKGRYYPPDPASRADTFIGGNIATNAGGPRCLKYRRDARLRTGTRSGISQWRCRAGWRANAQEQNGF